MIILPRQARDRHRKAPKKECRFLAGAGVGPFCNANCNGICHLGPATATQEATFKLEQLRIKMPRELALWCGAFLCLLRTAAYSTLQYYTLARYSTV